MVLVGGHRGSGCTDSQHAAPYGRLKYAENTLPSIQKAIEDGAEYIEIDVIQTKDDQLVVTHSNDLSLHVLKEEFSGLVSEYSLAELRSPRVGLLGKGEIPTLEEVMDICKDVILNIEIKDVKGTDDSKFKPDKKLLIEVLAEKLRGYDGNIVLSSFSEWDLIKAAEHIPEAKLGMLFETSAEKERSIYSSGEDKSKYLHFIPENLRRVADKVKLAYAHPCLGSVSREALNVCKELNLGVNAWSLNEKPPMENPEPVRQCAEVCLELDIPLTIMTDFVPEMREFLERYHQNS